MSYQTADKEVAARVAAVLQEFECSAFMAHEHIEVSGEWRTEILKEIEAADLFVAILSANYYNSIWCKQESGIAAYRKMTIIPLSTDGAIPQGFIAHIQSTKIDPAVPSHEDLLPGVAKHDVSFVIDWLVAKIGNSRSFRGAEANFELILPYIGKASRKQVVQLLAVSTDNGQICHANLCATKYLPPLVKTHGKFMDKDALRRLEEVLARYNKAP
ncbi:MAG: toll/interleukin-1 receptor domain-containing protein [Sulfuricaulis sp.]|uniref:toll/interleukin-1 receptor domain-containing protein n=1 Tax=Sulfuricaulis sp. TaxID=2003553 RepID=UPI0034A52F48